MADPWNTKNIPSVFLQGCDSRDRAAAFPLFPPSRERGEHEHELGVKTSSTALPRSGLRTTAVLLKLCDSGEG